MMDTKKCTKCGEEKPLDEFHKRSDRPGKYRSRCMECTNKSGIHSKRKVSTRDGFLICARCGEEKPEGDFYKRKEGIRKRRSKCKVCSSECCAEYRQGNEEAIRTQKLEYRQNNKGFLRAKRAEHYSKNKEACQARRKKWAQDNPDKVRRQFGRYPEKAKARNAVNNAVAAGRLLKPGVCSVCSSFEDRIEGHHEDYSRPLDVIWLCVRCHKRIDRLLQEELANSSSQKSS